MFQIRPHPTLSFYKMRSRIQDGLNFIISSSQSENYSNVIVFCHGGYIARLHQLLEKTNDRVLVENMDMLQLEVEQKNVKTINHIHQYQSYLTETKSDANPHTF